MPAQDEFHGLNDLHLKQELEAYVKEANCQVLPNIMGKVTRADLKRAIIWVAALRAEYLKAVVDLARLQGGHGDREALQALTQKRLAFEEALEGVSALRHAINQDYISVQADAPERP